MTLSTLTPRLANIRVHPIKSLDPVYVQEARIGPGGGVALDRAWALYSVDGRWVNGKRTPAIHLIRASYAEDLKAVTLAVPGDRRKIPSRMLAFPSEYESAAEWFSMYFEQQILVRYSEAGFPDDTLANGPTIVSTASLEAVAEWFPGLSVDNVRQRFRATLEIDGVPAFWEDQLFGEEATSMVRFRIGEVRLEGSNPCARCPVPPRDPCTGVNLDGFQKHFTREREITLPEWSPRERFDHFYRLSSNTRVASSEVGKIVRVGDALAFE